MNATTPQRAAASFKTLLESLRERLRGLFMQRSAEQPHGAGPARHLLLGLELLCKIEEQVVLPALSHAAPATLASAVRHASDELDLLRDLALMSQRTNSSNREFTFAVLEGLALLHFARGADLLDAVPADAACWPALEREVRGLLERWQREVQLHGEVEDEDRDPVGLPPR